MGFVGVLGQSDTIVRTAHFDIGKQHSNFLDRQDGPCLCRIASLYRPKPASSTTVIANIRTIGSSSTIRTIGRAVKVIGL
jgi:hypothetical protein